MRSTLITCTAAVCISAIGMTATANAAAADPHAWVAEEQQDHADRARGAGALQSGRRPRQLGVDGLDDQVLDLKPQLFERTMAVEERPRHGPAQATRPDDGSARHVRTSRSSSSPRRTSLKTSQLTQDNLLPYINLSQIVYQGTKALIDPQVAKDRYPASGRAPAQVRGTGARLHAHHAARQGPHRPSASTCRGCSAHTRARSRPISRTTRPTSPASRSCSRARTSRAGRSRTKCSQSSLRDYNEWLRTEVLPLRPRRFPPAARHLRRCAARLRGVRHARGAHPGRHTGLSRHPQRDDGARAARREGERLRHRRLPRSAAAPEVRAGRRRPAPSRRMASVLANIEEIIEQHGLVTLPKRRGGHPHPERRGSSRAAGAASRCAAPHRQHGRVPRVRHPAAPEECRRHRGRATTPPISAGMWTLTAHEARPGHELQFSSMIETGVSIARAVFAFNSANVEGWALYAEAITKPYEPLDGQLVVAPGPHVARRADVPRPDAEPRPDHAGAGEEPPPRRCRGLTKPGRRPEVERYTFRSPGQATAYYYGYMNLQALRTQTGACAQGQSSDQKAYHDFVLSQGLLPPELLKRQSWRSSCLLRSGTDLSSASGGRREACTGKLVQAFSGADQVRGGSARCSATSSSLVIE